MATLGFPFGPNAEPVLARRYLAKDPAGRVVETPGEMLRRVARAVAAGEEGFGGAAAAREWEPRFLGLMEGGLFLPNSPTLMNAGRPLGQLSACFVLPVLDSLESIFEAVKHTALIHKSGGGTGFAFSRLRPSGDAVASTGGVSSGPVSFMRVFDAATEAIKQGGVRRGANMAMLAVGHPDIELFIAAKQYPGQLSNFNLSVLLPDAFLAAVESGGEWPLVNPRDGRTMRRVAAAELFDRLARAAHQGGEPGVAFQDAIERGNPTPALGRLEATNPCGEQPLLPYESCNLGSLQLARFARGGAVDYPALEEAAGLAVRFLDDALEASRFPLPQVAEATRLTRKVGLGVMGFADLLLELGIPYAAPEAARLGGEVMARIQAAARRASVELGRARGSFPAFPASRWRREGFAALRNATVTTVAPTGTLSLLLGCSSGIEPHFALAYARRVLEGSEFTELNPRFLALLRRRGLASEANLAALAQSGRASAVAGLAPAERELFATATRFRRRPTWRSSGLSGPYRQRGQQDGQPASRGRPRGGGGDFPPGLAPGTQGGDGVPPGQPGAPGPGPAAPARPRGREPLRQWPALPALRRSADGRRRLPHLPRLRGLGLRVDPGPRGGSIIKGKAAPGGRPGATTGDQGGSHAEFQGNTGDGPRTGDQGIFQAAQGRADPRHPGGGGQRQLLQPHPRLRHPGVPLAGRLPAVPLVPSRAASRAASFRGGAGLPSDPIQMTARRAEAGPEAGRPAGGEAGAAGTPGRKAAPPRRRGGDALLGWWRCRDLNPGHCGYEPHALTN